MTINPPLDSNQGCGYWEHVNDDAPLLIVSAHRVAQGDTLVTYSPDTLGRWTRKSYREVLDITTVDGERYGTQAVRLQLHDEAVDVYPGEKVVILER